MSARDGCYQFINRSIAIYPMGKYIVQPGEESLIRVEAPFCESLCSTGVAKFFCGDKVDTILLRLVNTHGVVKYKNTSGRSVEISPSSPVGVIDLRSLGYFKVKYKDLVSRLSTKFTMYHYIKAPPLTLMPRMSTSTQQCAILPSPDVKTLTLGLKAVTHTDI